MNAFAIALACFVLLHIGVAATGLRAAIVGRIGESAYRAGFSLASLALLAWLIMAFGRMRADPFDPLNQLLWTPPAFLHLAAGLLIFLGVMFAVLGLTTPGPTTAFFEQKGLAVAEPARGALRITRHPFLWGVALWAAGHALVNGERFAVMLFGALGLMAVFGARSIDRKGAARNPEGWARFAAATSNAPFVAIFQRRNRFAIDEIGPWRVLAGLAAFVALALFHEALFGVSALSTPS